MAYLMNKSRNSMKENWRVKNSQMFRVGKNVGPNKWMPSWVRKPNPYQAKDSYKRRKQAKDVLEKSDAKMFTPFQCYRETFGRHYSPNAIEYHVVSWILKKCYSILSIKRRTISFIE